MLTGWMRTDLGLYSPYDLRENLPFFEANPNKITIFEGLIGQSEQI
jgi:hypothetical protein